MSTPIIWPGHFAESRKSVERIEQEEREAKARELAICAKPESRKSFDDRLFLRQRGYRIR